MRTPKTILIIFGSIGLLCCLAILLADVPVLDIGVTGGRPSGGYSEPSGNGVPGVPPPGTGNCANVNTDYPENPFRGWPVSFYAGDWRTIAAWWCDPFYLIDFGVNHWGVDIAAMVNVAVSPSGATTTTYDSIAGAEVVCTLQEEMYGYVISARDDGAWNFGMGNHVKVRALDCVEICGEIPDDPAPGEVYFLLEEDSPQCSGGSGTPTPGLTATPPNDPDDLILACTETDWIATYMHLATVVVAPLQLVERGDVLGTVDSTGNSTGHHLHYQINGIGIGAIDPAPAMCAGYSPELRVAPRWLRVPCGD